MILFQFNELVRANGNSFSKWTDSEQPQFIFELVYSDEQETKFLRIAGSHGILLAYHGSSVENFHSILHNGLLNLFNKVHVLVLFQAVHGTIGIGFTIILLWEIGANFMCMSKTPTEYNLI